MVTLFDPVHVKHLLAQARATHGHCYYELRATELAGRPAVMISFRRGDNAKPNVPSLLWLPWQAISQVAGLEVEVHGEASGVRLYLECLDAAGWGMRFNLGTDQSAGWRNFQMDPRDIAASWGPCSGKRDHSDPLQPVALVVEDVENRGSWTLGLGHITAQAAECPAPAGGGLASCTLERTTLALRLTRGERSLLSDFRLQGLLPGSIQREFRTLQQGPVEVAGRGSYSTKLKAGDLEVPCSVRLEQLTSQSWRLHYELQFHASLQLEQLDLRGRLAFRDAAMMPYREGEALLGTLDCLPGEEAVLAEPAIWEPLVLGGETLGRLRIRADGPILKSLRLLDLRVEEQVPEYAVEIAIAREEQFPAGTLRFAVVFDAG